MAKALILHKVGVKENGEVELLASVFEGDFSALEKSAMRPASRENLDDVAYTLFPCDFPTEMLYSAAKLLSEQS